MRKYVFISYFLVEKRVNVENKSKIFKTISKIFCVFKPFIKLVNVQCTLISFSSSLSHFVPLFFSFSFKPLAFLYTTRIWDKFPGNYQVSETFLLLHTRYIFWVNDQQSNRGGSILLEQEIFSLLANKCCMTAFDLFRSLFLHPLARRPVSSPISSLCNA